MTKEFIYGVHAVNALLNNTHRNITALYVNQSRTDLAIQDILNISKQKGINVKKLSAKEMQKKFADFPHQGIVAHASPLPQFSELDVIPLLNKSAQPALILILDGVTDPHNLGACIRSADAAGVAFILIPKDKSASITPVVSKVACGAAENIPVIRVTNLVRTIEVLKKEGIWIYGAAGEAHTSLYQMDCTGPMAIVMGAEGKGIRRLTQDHCDGLFHLPMLGSVSSLNVSVATGISLYEIIRQRQRINKNE